MSAPSENLEARLQALEHAVRRLGARLDRLEAARGLGPGVAELEHRAHAAIPDAPDAPGPEGLARGAVAGRGQRDSLEGARLAGRTILALAGAYLIRAFADSGWLTTSTGVATGLAYALAFTLVAHRAAAAGERLSASFHGLAGALMVYPLLVETTVRHGWLEPRLALAALTLAFVTGHAVALHHRIAFLAWLGAGLATATSCLLLVVTRQLAHATLAALIVAAVVEGSAAHRLWPGLRWPTALGADAAVLALAFVAGRAGGLPEDYPPLAPGAALLIALALPAVYLVSIATQTLHRGHQVGPFEVVQAVAALALGFGGGAWILDAHGGSPLPLSIAAVVLGAAAYSVAFAFVERRSGQAANFYFYSTAGGLLTLAGSATLFPDASVPFSCLALAAAGLGRRYDRQTLRAHAAAYLFAAALGCRLLQAGVSHALGRPLERLTLPGPSAWLSLVATLIVYALLAPRRAGPEAPAWRHLPPLVSVASLLVVGLIGTLAPAVAVALMGWGAGPQLALVRTGVLAALAVALAEAARRWGLRELGWLVFSVLALGGLKLAIEDMPTGHAASLFASFVLYGTALTVAPRLARAGRDAAPRALGQDR